MSIIFTNGITISPTPTIVSSVSSGLELYYDPSNPSSYPGSGTTLYDLSPSAVNASISGNPTDSGNWFTFTGTQSIQTGNLATLYSGWQHSLEVWFAVFEIYIVVVPNRNIESKVRIGTNGSIFGGRTSASN